MIEKGKTLSADDAEGRRFETANEPGWTRKITTETQTQRNGGAEIKEP
jgi:hypothetical protein